MPHVNNQGVRICNGLQSKPVGPAIIAFSGPHYVHLSPTSGPHYLPSEPAIIRLGLQSIASGQDYLQLNSATRRPASPAPRALLSW